MEINTGSFGTNKEFSITDQRALSLLKGSHIRGMLRELFFNIHQPDLDAIIHLLPTGIKGLYFEQDGMNTENMQKALARKTYKEWMNELRNYDLLWSYLTKEVVPVSRYKKTIRLSLSELKIFLYLQEFGTQQLIGDIFTIAKYDDEMVAIIGNQLSKSYKASSDTATQLPASVGEWEESVKRFITRGLWPRIEFLFYGSEGYWQR